MSFAQCLGTMLLALCLIIPAGLVAQPPATASDQQFFSAEHRQKLYEKSKKSEGVALLWTLALPPLGNIYAEEYFWAGISGILLVFAGTFVGYALTTDQDTFLVWGAVTGGVSYVTAGVTSVLGVRDHNHQLRRALKVSENASFETRGVSLSFSW